MLTRLEGRVPIVGGGQRSNASPDSFFCVWCWQGFGGVERRVGGRSSEKRDNDRTRGAGGAQEDAEVGGREREREV